MIAEKIIINGEAVDIPGNRYSNPNLLDNWYFIGGGSQKGSGIFPINQRGETTYSNTGYTIDRWAADTGLQIEEEYIHINSTLYQFISAGEAKQYLGKQLTLSILLKDNRLLTGTVVVPSAVNPNENQWAGTMTGLKPAIGIYVMKDGSMQLFRCNDACDAIAVKTELGSQQTLAHQDVDGNWVLNDPPPNFALELAKCQRYQFSVDRTSHAYGKTGNTGDTNLTVFIPLPTSPRANGTVSGFTATLYCNGKYKYLSYSGEVQVCFGGCYISCPDSIDTGWGTRQEVLVVVTQTCILDFNL